MSRSYLTAVNLNGNTLYNAALHPQGTAPSITALGQVWYDTSTKIVKVYDGSWNAVGNAVASAGGPTTTPSSAGSFYFDTTNFDLYVAKGNASSADWKPAVSGAQIPLNKIAAPTANYDISGSGFTIRATAPVNALDVVNKSYVDTIATGLNAHDAVGYASTANLTGTYANGTSGVGATLTNSGTQAVFALDGYTFQASDVTNSTRVLLKDQTFADQNGIYVLTTLGSVSTNWVLTRATDYNSVPNVAAGDFTFVINGTANGKFSFVQISKPAAISGNNTTANAITFSVFANGNISGLVTPSQGGTGSNLTATNGTFLVGNGTVFTNRALAASDRTALGATGKVSGTLNFTAATTATITHGLSTPVIAQAFDGSGNQIEVDVTSTGTTTVFSVAATSATATNYSYVIIG
jgi:hypothetical protein